MFFKNVWYFRVFKFSILTTNNTILTKSFILIFLVTKNILQLFHHSFHICEEKINLYNLANVCLLAVNPTQKYLYIAEPYPCIQ